MVCTWEARQSGRPVDNYTIIYLDAGLCRRPYCIQLGSPTLREAHYQDLHMHGSRSMPEALLCVKGKPEKSGRPGDNSADPSVGVAGCTLRTNTSAQTRSTLLLLSVWSKLDVGPRARERPIRENAKQNRRI